MANISVAKGDIVIRGDWDDDSVKRLNSLFDKARDWHYSTAVDEPFEKGKYDETSFFGIGRWTFTENLHRLGAWADPDENLVASMERNNLSLEWSFIDREDMLGVFYNASGVITASEGKLVYTETFHENIENTWEKAAAYREDYAEVFQYAVSGLADLIGVPLNAKRRDILEAWLEETLLPTDEETVRDFLEKDAEGSEGFDRIKEKVFAAS